MNRLAHNNTWELQCSLVKDLLVVTIIASGSRHVSLRALFRFLLDTDRPPRSSAIAQIQTPTRYNTCCIQLLNLSQLLQMEWPLWNGSSSSRECLVRAIEESESKRVEFTITAIFID